MSVLRAVLFVLLALVLAPRWAEAQTPCPQSVPGLTPGGSVFGANSAQWQSFFGAKLDATSTALGCLLAQTVAPGVTSLSANCGVTATPSPIHGAGSVGLGPGKDQSPSSAGLDPVYVEFALAAQLTSSITWTLPSAAAVPKYCRLVIVDRVGGITGGHSLSVKPLGTDTINGIGASSVLTTAHDRLMLESDGSSNWTIMIAPFGYSAGVDVRVFGAACDGSTVDSAVMQSAIDSLGALGGGVILIPPGRTCVLSSTLHIGNGSASAGSTYSNVILASTTVAAPFSIAFPAPNNPAVLKYTGSNNAIEIDGPLQGWGVRGINIDCTQSTGSTVGLGVISAQFGYFEDGAVSGCGLSVYSTTVSSLPSGYTNADSFHNVYHNLVLNVPDVLGAKGLSLTGFIAANTDYADVDNVTIVSTGLGAHTKYCVYLQATDTDFLRNIHCIPDAVTTAFTFDYTVNSVWPSSVTLLHVDPGSGAITQFQNVGTPSGGANLVNWLSNLAMGNGGVYPVDLPNLVVDHASGVWTPSIAGSTSAGTVSYSARAASYRINGRNVNLDFYLVTSSISGATGNLTVTGLPVVARAFSANELPSCAINGFSGIALDSGYQALSALIEPYNSPVADGVTIAVLENGSGKTSQGVTVADVTNPVQLFGTCSYHR